MVLKDIDKIVAQLYRWNNVYLNKILFKSLSKKERELLADNVKYKGKYEGKRCFIMGNGPSANDVDFSKLDKELVITVNEMFRHNDFDKLNSNFHFMADPSYLVLNNKNRVDAEIIEKIGLLSNSRTTLFLPIEAVNVVKRYRWEKKIKIQYFSSKLYFYDGYKEKIDFTKFIPSFQAVIHWCIAFAVYLGCNEIYLLGCDATNILTDISLVADRDTDFMYAYKLSKETVELAKKRRRRYGLEYMLYGYWKIVHLFSELYQYCNENDIKLYNCSEKSILDAIPKRKLQDVLEVR